MPAIKIRPMTHDDKPVLMEILHTTPEFKPIEVVVAEELIDSFLDSSYQSGYIVQVAELDSLVVGYICYGPTPLTEGTWDVYWIVTAPERQGKGIGTALLNHAENEIKKTEGRLIIIETSSKQNYEKTRHFHKNQGYAEICRIPDFYAPGDDRLILQKRLQ